MVNILIISNNINQNDLEFFSTLISDNSYEYIFGNYQKYYNIIFKILSNIITYIPNLKKEYFDIIINDIDINKKNTFSLINKVGLRKDGNVLLNNDICLLIIQNIKSLYEKLKNESIKKDDIDILCYCISIINILFNNSNINEKNIELIDLVIEMSLCNNKLTCIESIHFLNSIINNEKYYEYCLERVF